MTKYVPFLKAKQNEIKAISELSLEVTAAITPFFDFPKKNEGYSEMVFVDAVASVVSKLKRNLPPNGVFYLDNYDVEDTLKIGGQYNYIHLLKSVAGMRAIPVVGLDRTATHCTTVIKLKQSKVVSSTIVAFRICPDDFEEFAIVEDDLAANLAPVFNEFEKIDLVFDCRICTRLDPVVTAQQILKFSSKFCAVYPVRRVIVTGSSISAASSDILTVDSTRTLVRNELAIFSAVKAGHRHAPLVLGDYATVSPNYSEVTIAPEILQNVMTAKLTYTLEGAHYFIRGGAMKARGRGQYFGMAKMLCAQPFFRGSSYSTGDAYFDQKGRSQGNYCGPNTVIKPAVVAHISYMALDGPS